MANIGTNSIMHPAVGGAPGTTPAQAPDRAVQRDLREIAGNKTEKIPPNVSTESFEQILGQVSKPVTEPLKFSAHASARLQSRNLQLGPEEMRKLNEAVDKAAAKGLDDALVLSKDGAFIVSVKNRTVVTAMDRNAVNGNVFTNIDGAVIV